VASNLLSTRSARSHEHVSRVRCAHAFGGCGRYSHVSIRSSCPASLPARVPPRPTVARRESRPATPNRDHAELSDYPRHIDPNPAYCRAVDLVHPDSDPLPLLKASDVAHRLGASKTWVYRNVPRSEVAPRITRYRSDIVRALACRLSGRHLSSEMPEGDGGLWRAGSRLSERRSLD
jgi:hypothetical protein